MPVPNSRKYNRLRSLADDARVLCIQAAVAACDAAGRRRLHVANGEYAWPKNFVALLDEMRLNSVPDEQLLLVGDAMRDAAYSTVYVGTGIPTEMAGAAAAAESIAEGEANRDTALLIDAPHCPSRKRAAVRSISWHIVALERLKRVLHRDLTAAAR
jgi:flavin-dependent dehydrogenase